MRGSVKRDTYELGCLPHAGSNDTAEKICVLIDDGDRRRRSEIKDDKRTLIFFYTCNGSHYHICSELSRIVDFYV